MRKQRGFDRQRHSCFWVCALCLALAGSGSAGQPATAEGAIEQYRLDPIPGALEKMRGVHPRIYLTRARVAELREAIKTTHAALWGEVRELADRAVRSGPPAYRKDDGSSGDEQLWQRGVGNTMPHLAMAWAMTGEKKYLDSAREWALASCGYETWGLGRIDGMDLAAGHQLLGLGIVYDWCYEGLGEEARRTIRETLVRRTSAMFEAAATGKAWWRQSYLQNHLWVNICGMSVAGLALFGEVDDASKWIGLPLDKFKRTMDALGGDGASHEGVGYWQYGVEYMLKFMDLARALLDLNMYNHDWWRHTATYAQYLTLPRNAWTRGNSIVDIADCPRSNWYGPDYLLRHLARQYRDGYAQWLAREVDEADIDSPGARWLNLVWYDPTLEPKPPADRPTMHHFEEMGIVAARSDWSGDESLVVFKCGPFIGHEAVERFAYDPGGGHVHPDANHFVAFGAGEWLIRDDGYRAKWTGQHNTLLVDGRGQLGEGRQWFNGSEPLRAKARPRVIRAVSTEKMDHIVGDATEAYPKELGVRRYVRHLLFVKPDVLIVVDDVALDKAGDLELRFHPEQDKAERDGEAFLTRGKKAVLRLEPLTGHDIEIAAQAIRAEGREGGEATTMHTIRLRTQRARWLNAVALSWSPVGGAPKQVTFHEGGDVWSFAIADRSVSLNLKTQTATIGP